MKRLQFISELFQLIFIMITLKNITKKKCSTHFDFLNIIWPKRQDGDTFVTNLFLIN